MPDFLASIRAAFRVFRRRKGAYFLFVVLVGVLAVTVWGSYAIVREQRRTLANLKNGRLELFQLPINCESALAPPGQGGTEQPAPAPGGAELSACHLALPSGETFGPALDPSIIQGNNGQPPDPQKFKDFVTRNRPQIAAGLERISFEFNKDFAPRRIFTLRARSLGAIWGIAFVALLAATLFGAEWRWSVWRTLLSHEPRRARVLLGKLGALWLMVLIASIAALGVFAAVDAIFRVVYGIHAGGGHTIGAVALLAGRSLLGLQVYATIAAMFATIFRSSLAGLGGALAVNVIDGMATSHYIFLRHYLPDQQIAWLLPHQGRFLYVASQWWQRIDSVFRCGRVPGPNNCTVTSLAPIRPGTAAAVLGAWLVAATLLAYLVLRARDVPQ